MHLYQRKPDGPWHYEFRHKKERYRGTTGETKKDKARAFANKERDRVRSGQAGELPPKPERLTIAKALVEYGQEQQRRQRTPRHIDDTLGYLGRFADDAKINYVGQIDAPAIERGLAAIADRSPRTQNKVLAYIRAFCRWARKTGRAEVDPSRDVERVQQLPTQEQRRAFTPEEMDALTTREDIHPSRRLVYLVAAFTGLRRNELDTLERHHIDLDAGELTIEGKNAKNRKATTIPLTPIVVEAWRAWLASPDWYDRSNLRRGGRALPPVPNKQTLYHDLWKAGVIEREHVEGMGKKRSRWRYINTGPGWRLDFHCFRVTFITSLARAGVSLAQAQQLARHSDPKLTSTIYTRFDGADRFEAVRRLRDVVLSPENDAHKTPTRKTSRRKKA